MSAVMDSVILALQARIDGFIISETIYEEAGETTSEYFVSVVRDWRAKPASKRYRSMERLEAMLETHRKKCWLGMNFGVSEMEHFREFYKKGRNGKAIIAARQGSEQVQSGHPTQDKGVTDGLYIVAACNVRFVGHAVVLRVANGGQHKTVIDKCQKKPVGECPWMIFFAFSLVIAKGMLGEDFKKTK
ncbi:Hypothetical protein PHPALM_14210 [Phytophthora palmivora]|uniref:Uncharacterized protein n=1 Tax=Phytophthora palmivora TaxID=4796 RepID=A0A2P4XVB3_9STRA|nr:Hypothetical protein PHPALM_14210 [Phytophthora palmivora]